MLLTALVPPSHNVAAPPGHINITLGVDTPFFLTGVSGAPGAGHNPPSSQSIVPCLASPTFLRDMEVIGDNAWLARIRMKQASFLGLCRWLDKNTQLRATCARSHHPLYRRKGCSFLWMVSQGTTFRATATLFWVSWSTAHLLVMIYILVRLPEHYSWREWECRASLHYHNL